MRLLLLSGLAAMLVGSAGCGQAAEPADDIYVNANIITMNDGQPRAEALAVKDGKVLAVGSRREVEAHQGDATRVHDLEGHTITPGFIDGHGHLSLVGLQAAGPNVLPPPDGTVTSIAELQQTMRDWMSSSGVPKTYGFAFGWGYDDSQLEEQRHPTRDDLDAVSTDIPIYVSHQSGHLSVVNSKALEVLGVTRVSTSRKIVRARSSPASWPTWSCSRRTR
jgi:predicted amidohydrolase YtcJ